MQKPVLTNTDEYLLNLLNYFIKIFEKCEDLVINTISLNWNKTICCLLVMAKTTK